MKAFKILGIISVAAITLGIACNEESTSPENEAPTITSLTATPDSVATGQSAVLTCLASDSEGDSLSYAWDPAGGTLSGSGATVTWTAPSTTGDYNAKVTVADGHGGAATKAVGIKVGRIASEMMIGPGGGEILDPSGVKVTFPEGAVETLTKAEIFETEMPYFLPPGILSQSNFYKVDFAGEKLKIPASIEFPLSGVDPSIPAGKLGVYRWDGLQWAHVGGLKVGDSGGLKAEINGFSIFTLGSSQYLHKPVQFEPHMNTFGPVVTVHEFELAHPDLDAPVGNLSVAVLPPPFDEPSAVMSLPQGKYTFCYHWDEGEVDDLGNVVYYYRIIGDLPDDPAVVLNENSSDTVPPVIQLDTVKDGTGQCSADPTDATGEEDPQSPGDATMEDFVGEFQLRDPNRDYDTYHGELVLNGDGSFTSVETVPDQEPIEGQGAWTWTQSERFFTLDWDPGGYFEGEITGNTNDFTIDGTWSNDSKGQLRIYR